MRGIGDPTVHKVYFGAEKLVAVTALGKIEAGGHTRKVDAASSMIERSIRGLIAAFELLHSHFFSKRSTRDRLQYIFLPLREQSTTDFYIYCAIGL